MPVKLLKSNFNHHRDCQSSTEEDSDDPEEEDQSTDEDINNRAQNPLFFVESILQTRNEKSAFHLPQHSTQYYQTQIATTQYYLPTQQTPSTQTQPTVIREKVPCSKCGRSFLPAGMNKHLNACNKKNKFYMPHMSLLVTITFNHDFF